MCTPDDYKPFSFYRQDASFEELGIDLVQDAGKALGIEVVWVKST